MVNVTGIWNLLSFEYIINGTVVAQPNGPTPLGKIAIFPEGWISVQITTPGALPLPNDKKWADGTDHEIAEIARPYVSYAGRWSTAYVGEQLQLTTNVEVTLDPSWALRPQKRNVSFVDEGGKEYMLLKPVGDIPFNLPWVPDEDIPGFENATKFYAYDERLNDEWGGLLETWGKPCSGVSWLHQGLRLHPAKAPTYATLIHMLGNTSKLAVQLRQAAEDLMTRRSQ